jgi:hypothetical protein
LLLAYCFTAAGEFFNDRNIASEWVVKYSFEVLYGNPRNRNMAWSVMVAENSSKDNLDLDDLPTAHVEQNQSPFGMITMTGLTQYMWKPL